jgi:cytoskeleton protein RodZ
MPSIGDTLREARMRRGLDVADVEEQTKIRAKYLRALENEEFGSLPGPTFVRSFLRTYAEVLGLDPHVLTEEYRLHHEPRDEFEPQAIAAPDPRPRRERRYPGGGGGPGRGTLVAAGVVALLAFLLILGLTGGDDDGDDGERAAETGERSEREQQRADRERERRERRRSAPRGVALRVIPSEPVYACLDKGPGTDVIFEGILESPRLFRGKRVRINLGKTSARLRVNGREVRFERGAQPVGFDFSGTRPKPLPLGQRPCASR